MIVMNIPTLTLIFSIVAIIPMILNFMEKIKHLNWFPKVGDIVMVRLDGSDLRISQIEYDSTLFCIPNLSKFDGIPGTQYTKGQLKLIKKVKNL